MAKKDLSLYISGNALGVIIENEGTMAEIVTMMKDGNLAVMTRGEHHNLISDISYRRKPVDELNIGTWRAIRIPDAHSERTKSLDIRIRH